MTDDTSPRNCPKCGSENVEATPIDGGVVYHIFNLYHPEDGEFKFKVSCRDCEWTDKRRIKTEVIQE